MVFNATFCGGFLLFVFKESQVDSNFRKETSTTRCNRCGPKVSLCKRATKSLQVRSLSQLPVLAPGSSEFRLTYSESQNLSFTLIT